MKKLLLLLLIAPVLGFGQVLTDILYFDVEQQKPYVRYNSLSTPYFINGEYKDMSSDNPNDYLIFEVPEGKLWQIKQKLYYPERLVGGNHGFNEDTYYKENNLRDLDSYTIAFIDDDDFKNDNYTSIYPNSHNHSIVFNAQTFSIDENLFLQGGTKFVFSQYNYFRVIIYEYSFDGNSFSYNEPEAIKNNSNTPVLFPNPTSSLLALNSDKEYDIEVYDMAGNKVMALTGNTIDMSHLSSATYIVKALDKVENEEVSYKVVKN